MTVTAAMVAMVAAVAEATGVATVMEAAVGVAAVEEAGAAGVVAATAATVTTIEAAAEAEVVLGVAAVTAGVVVAMTWVGGGQAVEIAAVSRSSIRLTSAMRPVAAAEVTEAAVEAAATAT